MNVCINKSILGSKKHLLVSGESFSWVDAPPPINTCTYGFKDQSNRIEPLLDLYSISVSSISTEAESRSFRSCGYFSVPPWPKVLGKREFMLRVEKVCSDISDALKKISENPYSEIFFKGNHVLGKLVDARVDVSELVRLSRESENATLRHYANSITGSISVAPTYNRIKTKTGRLTISSGPPVLTLPKQTRNAYRSQFTNGAICELDFTSLEPRCASNIAGNPFLKSDLYEQIMGMLDIDIERDSIKELVICLLYGAGEYRARSILKKSVSDRNVQEILKSVKSFFAFDKLRKDLLEEAKSGIVHNYFGRPINVDSIQAGVLINNYIQSTAVDLSLIAFSDLVSGLNPMVARPLFIIHDALMLDVNLDRYDDINSQIGDYYSHEALGIFPWKIRRL